MCEHGKEISDIALATQKNTDAISSIGKTIDRIDINTSETNGRVRMLENWRWFILEDSLYYL